MKNDEVQVLMGLLKKAEAKVEALKKAIALVSDAPIKKRKRRTKEQIAAAEKAKKEHKKPKETATAS